MIVWICAEETKEMEEKEFFDYIDNVIKKSPNRLNSISDLIMGAYRNDKAVLDYVLLYTKEQDFDWFDILETSLFETSERRIAFSSRSQSRNRLLRSETQEDLSRRSYGQSSKLVS